MECRTFSRVLTALLVVASFLVSTPAFAADCTPEISSNGNLTVIAFKTVGTCTWSTPAGLTMFKGLIIGGGGGGGSAMGGGGGGGGYVEFDSLTATSEVFTIVVGDGGIAGTATNSGPAGVSGGNSSISGTGITLTSRGGAGGASLYSGGHPAQLNGGSGGGAAGYSGYTSINSTGTQTSQTQTPLLSTIGGKQYGFDGSPAGTTWYPGGGGGAGASGTNSPANGGAGRANAILGTSYLWAGGGGGSGYSGDGGNGGSGGGGAGGTSYATPSNPGTGGINTSTTATYVGSAGASNTGGGGGGGTWGSLGAKGGSGIVILSYLSYVGPASVSLQLASNAISAGYRSTTIVEALVNTAGLVTFYQAGKLIPGCKNRATTGTSPNIKATCSWKPAIHGSVSLSAKIAPSSASYSANSSTIYRVPVGARSGQR